VLEDLKSLICSTGDESILLLKRILIGIRSTGLKQFKRTTSVVGSSSRCDRGLDSAAIGDLAEVLWSWNWMSISFAEDLHATPQVVTRSGVDG